MPSYKPPCSEIRYTVKKIKSMKTRTNKKKVEHHKDQMEFAFVEAVIKVRPKEFLLYARDGDKLSPPNYLSKTNELVSIPILR